MELAGDREGHGSMPRFGRPGAAARLSDAGPQAQGPGAFEGTWNGLSMEAQPVGQRAEDWVG
eukprot:13326287-Alexandrium_andersonii.AAC.1